MLIITIPASELFDETKNEFVSVEKDRSLVLEHSLVSLSKWESKWKKPFLAKEQKSMTESIDYIRCMTITQNVDPEIYKGITSQIVEQVSSYIEDSMTATTFAKQRKTINREIITSEIIYYWMVTLNIPWEAQKWHLNRLLTLINVCNIKNQPQKKMGRKALLERNKALNASRRNSLHSKG